jgi:hypothetical protein
MAGKRMNDSLGAIYSALQNSFDNESYNKSEFRLSRVEAPPYSDISSRHVLNGVDCGVNLSQLNNLP